jgi:hypothetical protein
LGEKYQDLLYVRRKFIHNPQLRNAIAEIINATFNIPCGKSPCAAIAKLGDESAVRVYP